MTPLCSSQPFKAIYFVYFLADVVIRLPFRLIYYLPRQLRPVRTWSLKTCLTVALLRDVFDLVEATHYQGAPPPDPKNMKKNSILLEPPNKGSIYRGVLTPTKGIQPVPRVGVWIPNPEARTAANKEKVVIHFPAGSFIFGYDPAVVGPPITGLINKYVQPGKVLFAQYRISISASTRFPAAVQDAVTFYHGVIESGVDAKDIILSGDSAGGNLVLALLRYLETGLSGLPLPGGAMVWSPWVHITKDVISQYGQSKNIQSDCATPGVLQYGSDAYLPEGEVLADVWPYISPLHHPFTTRVPLFIQAGTAEILYEEIKSFANEMLQIEGNTVLYHETESCPHDILVGHELYNFVPQARLASTKATEFFRQNTP